jgi:hypothetical protein
MVSLEGGICGSINAWELVLLIVFFFLKPLGGKFGL